MAAAWLAGGAPSEQSAMSSLVEALGRRLGSASCGAEEVLICEVGGEGFLAMPWFGDGEQRLWRPLRGFLYLMGLGWCFMGVALAADVFMGAIEHITSKKKRTFSTATQRFVTTEVWNPTVANLTLMALGSSAPEILLSAIELFGKEFYAGDLGPSTIVGSAALNLFLIIAVCVSAIEGGEVRYIKQTNVYCVTASWSILAYFWLIVVLLIWSPHVVEPLEGIITFMFFPLLIVFAYAADRGTFSRKADDGDGSRIVAAELTKEELAELTHQVRAIHGELKEEQLIKIINCECQEPTSRAKYRAAAIRNMTGGKKVTVSDANIERVARESTMEAGVSKSKSVRSGAAQRASARVSRLKMFELRGWRFEVNPEPGASRPLAADARASDEAAAESRKRRREDREEPDHESAPEPARKSRRIPEEEEPQGRCGGPRGARAGPGGEAPVQEGAPTRPRGCPRGSCRAWCSGSPASARGKI
ncbi:unnamed protein product [Prorocentrum cordatum]|uniref:Sodium/calcium exchanger membrane region domain-containing protein n=1 Tax=Prorocentrum cordatum TaxID=2364126 RepID=A0ABN9U0L4_9DINO|nr:unnamed protein product [Polarella glacialis]